MNSTTNTVNPELEPAVIDLDQALFSLVNGINILDAVNPVNLAEQRQAFFDSKFSIEPNFQYGEHGVDSFNIKRQLFCLNVDAVKDEDLRNLYIDVIESYVDKIDQFSAIGTSDFLYTSLRYYGEPSQKDIRNAHFLLHLSDDNSQEPLMDAESLKQHLEAFALEHGYEYQIDVREGMIANALVSGSTVKVNQSAQVSRTEAEALAHHELGVHLLTTLNGRDQALKILNLGLPMNTMTQEGLAILCEYLSGNLTIKRLQKLALRVLAVQSMIKERSFKQTFMFLMDQYGITQNEAFSIVSRVYRGGGFTKDYVYLQGLQKMLLAYESESNFHYLFCGKTSIDYLPRLNRLIEKNIFTAPKRQPPALVHPANEDAVLKFIAHAIK